MVGLQQVTNNLANPMFATFAPGDTERLFVAERSGKIRIVDLATDTLASTPFLSIPSVATSGEGGLLGMAFHPDYQTNGKFYVYATFADGPSPFRSHIREYTVSANPDVANPTSAKSVLIWNQPQSNHNGGWIGFSPNDEYLYIMSGDGGNGNDSGTGHTAGIGNAQDITNNLLGKALRIDVNGDDFPADASKNYAIPASNPFVGVTGDDEIWAYGLRNPFRASFDRQTGDLWIGDVGQNTREEIDFQAADSLGGENYGWRVREGFIQNPSFSSTPVPAGAVDPVYDYPNGGSAAVTGGYVYRGPDPELQGQYFFSDTQQRFIRTFDPANPIGTAMNIQGSLPIDTGSIDSPVSFAEDAHGNLYIVDITGEIYRFVTDAVVSGDFNASGLVDTADLPLWQTGYGAVGNATYAQGDADEDADVDGQDFLLWQRQLGRSSQDPAGLRASSNLVPEPGTWAMIWLGLLSYFGKRPK